MIVRGFSIIGADARTTIIEGGGTFNTNNPGGPLDASVGTTLVIGDDPGESGLHLTAETGSMEVVEGTGGIMDLTDADRVEIKKTLEEEVLTPGQVEFRSTRVAPTGDGQRLEVAGELELNGQTHQLAFELEVESNGAVTGTATVKQSEWEIKPYSGLFGTLKVRDEVRVIASVPPPQAG